MPLCNACRSEVLTKHRNRVESYPPHGMEWGESCDGCNNAAVVTFRL